MSSDRAARDSAVHAQAIANHSALVSRFGWLRLVGPGLALSGLVLSVLVLFALGFSALGFYEVGFSARGFSARGFSARGTERGRVVGAEWAASATATGDTAAPIYEIAPQLVPPSDPCYDQWSEVLGEPSREESDWRKQLNHGIYRVAIGDTQLARIELLSSASPALCEGDPDWKMRQTQVLITYYLTDGDTKDLLYEFVDDDVFYDRAPRIDARGGTVVLQGVQFDGSRIHVTLQLELLRELYEAVVPTRHEPRGGLLTADRSAERECVIG